MKNLLTFSFDILLASLVALSVILIIGAAACVRSHDEVDS